MKTYHVKFWYYTDLRTEWKGEATGDFAALGVSMFDLKMQSWCDAPGFKVTIEKV